MFCDIIYDLTKASPETMWDILKELDFDRSFQDPSMKIDLIGDAESMSTELLQALKACFARYKSNADLEGLSVGDFQDFLLDCGQKHISKDDIRELYKHLTGQDE